jgi:hypothetical protein
MKFLAKTPVNCVSILILFQHLVSLATISPPLKILSVKHIFGQLFHLFFFSLINLRWNYYKLIVRRAMGEEKQFGKDLVSAFFKNLIKSLLLTFH